MSRPKLDRGRIRSELSESVFFQGRAPLGEAPREMQAGEPAPREPARRLAEPAQAQPGSGGPEPRQVATEEMPTPVRASARTLARIPFEIYQDQHATLKQFSLGAQTRGEKGSMSQMVREALDVYIAGRRRSQ
jgi:hypothetical protein